MSYNKKQYTFCKVCGYNEDNHLFRHLIDKYTIDIKYDDNGPIFIINCDNYNPVISYTKCSFPQCNSKKEFHANLFKHEFIGKKIELRQILIGLPDNISCRTCKNLLKNHNGFRHPFNYKIELLNKTDNDIIKVINITDHKIMKQMDEIYYNNKIPIISGKMAEKMI
jgi:hypothetical protein